MQTKPILFARLFLTAMLMTVVQPAFAQYEVLQKDSLYDWIENPVNKK